MPEEILPSVFRVEVPLPGNPLKSINSYFFKADRNLIIDTGMNRPECREAMQAGIDELRFDLRKTDLFVSHFHADHIGLISEFATDSSKVYFSKPEADFLLSISGPGGYWGHATVLGREAGFPEEEIQNAIQRHPGQKYVPAKYPPFTFIAEGDVIGVGDYRLECIETPGHTFCHMCLYEREKKFLISGDHVLGDITPNISGWSRDKDPLGGYLKALDKVDKLDVELVLPAHRRVFRNFHERIEELRHHHELRAAEALDIVKQDPHTPYQVASKMKWDIKTESWATFPIMQKWFAVGEALAHLLYLEGKGLVRKELRETNGGQVAFYSTAVHE